MGWELVGQDGRRQAVWDGMVAGRGSDADWMLADGRASRRHAQFSIEGDCVIVRDLGSTNGAYVNGAFFRNTRRAMRAGDRLRIGDATFTLRQVSESRPQDGRSSEPPRAPAGGPRPIYPPQPPAPAQQAQWAPQPVAPPAPAYPPAYPYGAGQVAYGEPEPRDWLTTLLLCIFVGSLGIHRFYTGHIFTGILMLLTLGFGGIWTVIDLIIIATNNFKDKQGRPLVRR